MIFLLDHRAKRFLLQILAYGAWITTLGACNASEDGSSEASGGWNEWDGGGFVVNEEDGGTTELPDADPNADVRVAQAPEGVDAEPSVGPEAPGEADAATAETESIVEFMGLGGGAGHIDSQRHQATLVVGLPQPAGLRITRVHRIRFLPPIEGE